MFLLSFKNSNDEPTIDSFDEYYISLVEINDCNALIGNKPFFDQPVKNKQHEYEKLIEMSRNNYYTTGSLVDYFCHQQYYKLISVDLSRQKNSSISQQINLTEKLEEGDGVTMLFLLKRSKKPF